MRGLWNKNTGNYGGNGAQGYENVVLRVSLLLSLYYRDSNTRIRILEKAPCFGLHASGRNSGLFTQAFLQSVLFRPLNIE